MRKLGFTGVKVFVHKSQLRMAKQEYKHHSDCFFSNYEIVKYKLWHHVRGHPILVLSFQSHRELDGWNCLYMSSNVGSHSGLQVSWCICEWGDRPCFLCYLLCCQSSHILPLSHAGLEGRGHDVAHFRPCDSMISSDKSVNGKLIKYNCRNQIGGLSMDFISYLPAWQ